MATADGSATPKTSYGASDSASGAGQHNSFGRRLSPPVMILPPPAMKLAADGTPRMTSAEALEAVLARIKGIKTEAESMVSAALSAAGNAPTVPPASDAASLETDAAPPRPLRPAFADHVVRAMVLAGIRLRGLALHNLARRGLALRGSLTLQGLTFQGLAQWRPRWPKNWANARGSVLQLGAYAAVLCALFWGGMTFLRTQALSEASATPRQAWVNIPRTFKAFEVSVPDFAVNDAHYVFLKHEAGGGRRDIVSWGEREGDAPHFLIEVYRPGDELSHFSGTMAAISKRADVPVSSIRSLDFMDSKFGPVSLAAFPATPDSPHRMCMGFVRQFEHPKFSIVGWQCGDHLDLRDHHIVSCALDRLSLLASGSNPRLAVLFARAELKRDFCGQREPLLAATPRYNQPSEDGAAAELRTQISVH